MGKINCYGVLFQAAGEVAAFSPLFNIQSSGKTADEALKSLKEAVGEFLKESKKDKVLEGVLDEAGFVETGGEWESPAFTKVEKFVIDL